MDAHAPAPASPAPADVAASPAPDHPRALFDLPDDEAYLNAAYIGPMPKTAIAAMENALPVKAQPWALPPARFFDDVERARAVGARLFNARPDDIALVHAASYGLASAAANLPVEAGQEILVLAEQFPSNLFCWRELAQACGGAVRTVARAVGQTWTQALLDAIGPQTALVACGHVHWIDGGVIDLVAVGEAVRAQGAALALDLPQALGALPFDARAVQPDFAVAPAYKWLCGPYATGFLYVAPHRQNGRPLEHNWISRAGADDFTTLTQYAEDFAPGARRFDMGERSNFHTLPGLIAACETLAELDPAATARACSEANAAIIEALAPLGFHADTPDRAPHYLAITAPDDAPDDIVARLSGQRVHISKRGPRLRITPHAYTTDRDVDRLAEAVRDIMGR